MALLSPYVQKYPKRDIAMGEVLGMGSFGVVQKGKIKDLTVALKIITMKMKQDAEVELNSMSGFSHRNVLRLLGVIEEDFKSKPILIFEYMENGSLNDFVQKNTSLDNTALTGLVYDVACGMDYLHEMQYVHRDLAGRNVLVDAHKRAKVADFGLSRFVDTEITSYYRINADKPLPLRWVPKESVPSETTGVGKFSFASDVWSFGVTIWETWTQGGLPYRKLSDSSNTKVEKAILQGKNPNDYEVPKCPSEIIEIMDSIFQVDPKKRPSFAVLKIKLDEIKGGKVKGNVPLFRKPAQELKNPFKLPLTKALQNMGLKSVNPDHISLVRRLKENGRIKTERVEKIMAAVDRGDYVTSDNPYTDKPQSIGCRVNISAPHMVGETGTVVGVEHMDVLARQSIDNIKKSHPEIIQKGIIRIVVGDCRKGYAEGGPYDVIHIGASTPILHQALINQLREGGIIVTPLGPPGEGQQLVVAEKIGGVMKQKNIMGVIFAALTSQSEQLKK